MTVPVTETSTLLATRPGGSEYTRGYVRIPGTTGNVVTTPDVGNLDITGDITIIVLVAPDDWTPSTAMTIVSKWLNNGAQRGYRLDLNTAGTLSLFWSTDGTTNPNETSSVAAAATAGVGDGEWLWLAVTLDVNDGGGGADARFWYSTEVDLARDDVTWTQLGTTQPVGSTTSIFNSSAVLQWGGHSATTQLYTGLISHVTIKASIGGAGMPTGGNVRLGWDAETDLAGVEQTATLTAGEGGHTLTVNTGSAPVPEVVPPGFKYTDDDAEANSVPVGVGDWRLHVERIAGNADGAVWDIDTWATDESDADAGEWATLGWESLVEFVRGMEWTRGAQAPGGRPDIGEIGLTLGAHRQDEDRFAAKCDPWVNYGNCRPGIVLRAALTSELDVRADGWIPLWAGVVESWTPRYSGARGDTGYRADLEVDVAVLETLSWLTLIDDNAIASTGSGDTILDRVDRLLTNAEWPFGRTSLFGPAGEPTIALQATDMAANRVTEVYLSADSTTSVVMSDVTGQCMVTDRSGLKASRLAEFTVADFGFGDQPMFVLDDGDTASATWHLDYDADSLVVVNDPEPIINDHRYTRAGGTQQTFEHAPSIGQFGRRTRSRNDLICTTDGDVLAIAEADNDREARTAMRIDVVSVTATGRGAVLLAVAAADWGDGIWLFPPASSGFSGSAVGKIRSLTHQVTPLHSGGVHWTASWAVDFTLFVDVTGAILPEAS